MKISTILVALASLMFFMIGADKFLNFLEPPCSMMDRIPSAIWMLLGAMQIAAGILIWFPKIRRPLCIFFALFMLTFTIVHLVNGQSDIGGSAFMAVHLGLIAWNPRFIRGRDR